MRFPYTCLFVILSFSASAQLPAIDFGGVDSGLTAEPTEILVLGTAHLGGYEDSVQPPELDPLRDKLAAFRPDVITIESVPGEVCETLAAYPSEYPEVGDQYCYDVSKFRAESGLTMAEALAEVRGSLQAWPDSPEPARRRRLAAAFLAANDPYSALVQWFRLPQNDRVAGDALGDSSVVYLTKLATSMNENVQLGAMLAACLGLERVYPVDDHSADMVFVSTSDSVWSHMQELWATDPVGAHAEYERLDSVMMAGPDGILDFYRALNSPRLQRMSTDSDLRVAMNDTDSSGIGRRYLAWWQTRNLRMVASIVAAAADAPGGRVLSVVGSSHKPYFDDYLDRMHDVRLVDAGTVLR